MKIFCNVKFGMSNNDNDNNKAGLTQRFNSMGAGFVLSNYN